MMKNKKGFAPIAVVASFIFGAPMVALGIAAVIALFVLGFYLVLGRIIGVGLIVFGGFLTYRMSWKIGLPMMMVGLLVYTNPMNWDALTMVGWQ